MVSALYQQRLAACLTALKLELSRHKDGRCRVPRFDRQLFVTRGTQLADYMQEIENNFKHLCTASDEYERRWLAEKLTAQIAALQREGRTQQMRPRQERPVSTQRQQKLDEYREYQRRLQTMIDEREQRLAHAETLSVQRKLKQDLEVLEGRMTRCCQAIRAVSWSLLLSNDAS